MSVRDGFVKSADTGVSVDRSAAELQKLLRRYGASGFGMQSDYEAGIIRIFFRVPDDLGRDAPQIPVRLEVQIATVFRALWGRSAPTSPQSRGKDWQQAERVAWRHLVLWVDAALSSSVAGLQKLSEAFLAHTLVQGADGRVRRVVDQMDAASNGNWRALLAPPEAPDAAR